MWSPKKDQDQLALYLPVAVRGLVQQIKSFERMAAEAAVTGDYHKALVAMTINPLIPSDTIAKKNTG